MHTESNPSGELRGQVSTLGDWICPSTDQLLNECKHIHVGTCVPILLSIYFTDVLGYWPRLNIVPQVNVNSDYTPTAIGGVIVDRYERLQYRFVYI